MAKLKRVVTPVGIAFYPWLSKADTKFVPVGVYSCNVFINRKEAEPLIKLIDKSIEDNLAFEKEKTGKANLKRSVNNPYEIGDKSDGVVPKGQVMFKIKQNAKIKDNDFRPQIYNRKSELIDVEVYGGSKVKVAFDIYPWHVASTGVGVSLKLIGVQVLELQERPLPSGGSLGFKEEEGDDIESNTTNFEKTNGQEKKEISNEEFV